LFQLRLRTDQALRKRLGRSLADIAMTMHELEINGQLPNYGDDVRGVERLRGLAKDLDGLSNTLPDGKAAPEAHVSPSSDDTYAASCH